MRIAYVVADRGIPYHGTKGASIHVRAITAALTRLGHQVTCLVARQGEPQEVETVPVQEVGLDPFMASVADGLRRPGSGQGRDMVRRREAAALFLNEFVHKSLAEIHRRLPLDLIIERYSLWSYAGVRAAHELGVPCILEVNAPLPEEQRRFRSLQQGFLATAIGGEVLRQATGIQAVSRQMAVRAVEMGADPERVTVVANGYDASLIQPQDVRRDGGLFTVGFVGSLRPWHGIEFLCQAFALFARSHGNARLLLVGDGPLRAWVEEFAAAEGLGQRIELVGAVDHRTVPSYMARFSVAVAPYVQTDDFYFSPLKIFEYMGAGLPILAARTGQIEEVLDHCRTAWLTPPGDIEVFVRGLELLADSADLCQALGRQAAVEAVARHRWEDVANRVVAFADTLAPRAESRP